uniref:Uncharacterized protein n=1 Tax=Panagrolaimus superbus TaxID=310955 RepID=A0A914XWU7_9BILA
MPKSVEYSAPEYSDDEEPVVKPKEKKAVKESKNDEKIILPSQMGYKPKERFSLNPPPNPSDRISDNKPLQFRGRPPPRRVKRNERNGENSRESRRYEKFRGAENGRTMISTNLRPVREGTEFVNDQIHILYQSSPSVKNLVAS